MARGMSKSRLLAVWVLCVVAAVAGQARASPFGLSREDTSEDEQRSGDLDAEDLVGRATVGRVRAPGTSRGEAFISLGGFTRRNLYGDREVGGLVVVGLPFERIARGSRQVRSQPVLEEAGLVNASVTSAPEAAASAITPAAARATVEAAWRSASLGSDDGRLDAILSRAHWSALLPETRLRAIRYDDQRLSTAATVDESRLSDSTGANVGLEARLTWRFDRLLYAEDEPAFERIRLEHHDARMRVASRVLEALFQWNRAWLEVRWAQAASREAREPPNHPSRDEIEAQLRVAEAEAALDVLTGGWFTSRRSRVTPAAPAASGPPRSL